MLCVIVNSATTDARARYTDNDNGTSATVTVNAVVDSSPAMSRPRTDTRAVRACEESSQTTPSPDTDIADSPTAKDKGDTARAVTLATDTAEVYLAVAVMLRAETYNDGLPNTDTVTVA